jgi:hypothetical protein
VADPDYEFMDGFDKYGAQRTGSILSYLNQLGEWPNVGSGRTLRPGIYGGSLLRLGQLSPIGHTAPALHQRMMGGFFYRVSQLISPFLSMLEFRDNASAVQCTLGFDAAGYAQLRRGTDTGTILATATTDPISALTVCFISWDVTVKSTGGAAKVWVNGNLVINISGVDTANAAGDGCARFQITPFTATYAEFDHLYTWWYLVSGGSELPLLDGPVIETDFPLADIIAGFDTSPITLLGSRENIVDTAISAGANTLYMRRLQAETSGDLTALYMNAQGDAGAMAMRAAVYADDNGNPGVLLSQANPITTIAFGVQEFPLLTSVPLQAGDWVWVGFHNQTTSPQVLYDSTNLGRSLSRSYASGLPDPMPTMTSGALTWSMYGKIENGTDNFAPLTGSPVTRPDPFEGNVSSTVGAEDRFIFGELDVDTATIHRVAVKAFLSRSNTDPRTVDLTTTVGSTTAAGSNPGFTPPATNDAWVTTYLPENPDTLAPWEGRLEGVQHGYQNVS